MLIRFGDETNFHTIFAFLYRMLKCLIVPLLVSSITSAIGSLDLSMSGKIATRYMSDGYACIKESEKNIFIFDFRSIIYYLTTTVCAVVLGIILVCSIRPGQGGLVNEVKSSSPTRQVLTADTLLDLVR